MKVKVTYPSIQKEKVQRSDIIKWAKWLFLFAAYICPIINICTGGKAWSVIVLWSLFIVWSLIFSPSVIEYNRISQSIKLITQSCILLILINALLTPGWAAEVVPIVCFSGLIVVGVLFFTDLERQKHNMLPMLLLTIVAFIAAVIGLIVLHDCSRWPLVVMGAISFALLIACVLVFDGELVRELKKLFHAK